MRIVQFDEINNTPAVRAAVDAWHALLVAGHCGSYVLLAWDHSALLALDDDDTTMGVLTYSISRWRKVVDVHLGFVYPQFRGRGVYRSLWDDVVMRARAAGMSFVEGSIAAGNSAMRRAAQRLGREEPGVYSRYRL